MHHVRQQQLNTLPSPFAMFLLSMSGRRTWRVFCLFQNGGKEGGVYTAYNPLVRISSSSSLFAIWEREKRRRDTSAPLLPLPQTKKRTRHSLRDVHTGRKDECTSATVEHVHKRAASWRTHSRQRNHKQIVCTPKDSTPSSSSLTRTLVPKKRKQQRRQRVLLVFGRHFIPICLLD